MRKRTRRKLLTVISPMGCRPGTWASGCQGFTMTAANDALTRLMPGGTTVAIRSNVNPR
jgi:hypothetical protein